MELYKGNLVLQPLADNIGLGIDVVNFLLAQFTALFLSHCYRARLSHASVSPVLRHVVNTGAGLALGYFCYGSDMLYVIGQAVGSYLLILYLPMHLVPRCVMVGAMGLLSVLQVNRVLLGIGNPIDVSGTLMISTQKVTSLALGLGDGAKPDEETKDERNRKENIKKMPSVLEFASYVFYFQGIMCGPFAFYNDYIAFIESRHIYPRPSSNQNGHGPRKVELPSPRRTVLRKMGVAVAMMLCIKFLTPLFPAENMADPEFHKRTGVFKRVFMLYLTCIFDGRIRYYCAWTLGEAISNASGFGFNGYDARGEAKWNLLDNLDIFKIETATSFKVFTENWNQSTVRWLRYVCYSRVSPRYATLLTVCLSAVWHGFYPGYYFGFLTLGLMTEAARKVRSVVRPYFLSSRERKLSYDVITLVFTQLFMNYTMLPFRLLGLALSWEYFWQHYFIGHICAIAVLLVLPSRRKKRANENGTAKTANAHSNGITHSQEVHNHANGDLGTNKVSNGIHAVYESNLNNNVKKKSE